LGTGASRDFGVHNQCFSETGPVVEFSRGGKNCSADRLGFFEFIGIQGTFGGCPADSCECYNPRPVRGGAVSMVQSSGRSAIRFCGSKSIEGFSAVAGTLAP
jgi:hypothetical protein